MKSLLRKLHIPASAREWHSLFGMAFLLVLMFLFLTGTASVFGREINWLFTPEQRVALQPQGKQAFGKIYDSVKAAYPDAQQLSLLRLQGARFADHVTVVSPGQGKSLVYVDPYTASVQGVGSVNNLWRTLRELHRGLSSGQRSIEILVTLMAIPLAVMLLSSLLLYPKFYRGLLRLPRPGTRLRAQLGDLHRLIGAWSVVFIAIVVLTSTEFMIESMGLGPKFYPSYTEKAERDAEPLPKGFSGADLDKAVAVAVDTFPGLEVADIIFPSRAGKPLAIRGELTSRMVRPSANSVSFDPTTLTVRGAYRAETSGIGLWIFEAMRTAHFGTFGGLTTRVLWLIFGLGLSTLAALGALIYAERLIFMSERSDKYRSRSRFGHVWFGMGIGKWIGLALCLSALWWTFR